MEEVWRGVPVTDEALTQCIKTLRRQLGDEAARPRFIETVPKHGYRFIAPVEPADRAVASPVANDTPAYGWRNFLTLGLAGTAGGGLAGILGGLFYGFGAASLGPGMGAASVLLVLLCLTFLLALIGGAAVSFGIATAGFAPGRAWQWSIVGGAAGGLVVGAVVKLLGTDAFQLLLGRTPGDITGGPEGALLGAAVGLGAWLGGLSWAAHSLRRAVAAAALVGAATGLLIAMLGGRLYGGSLDLLARHFPGSRLRLDQIGALVGESGFGPASLLVTSALEGALFAGCIVGAVALARRRLAMR
jgi:hypothetical protein